MRNKSDESSADLLELSEEETGLQPLRGFNPHLQRLSGLSAAGLLLALSVLSALHFIWKRDGTASEKVEGNVVEIVGFEEVLNSTFKLEAPLGTCLHGSPTISYGKCDAGQHAEFLIVESKTHHKQYHLRMDGNCLGPALDAGTCDSRSLWSLIPRSDLRIDVPKGSRAYQLKNVESNTCLYLDPTREWGQCIPLSFINDVLQCMRGPALGMYQCLDDPEVQLWYIQSSDGSEVAFASENSAHKVHKKQIHWEDDCEDAGKERIASVREFATVIGAGAKHHLVELTTDKEKVFITDLNPKDAFVESVLANSPNIVKCMSANRSMNALDVEPLVHVMVAHNCSNMQGLMATIQAENITMDEFKDKVKQFLVYYPNYGLLTSSCQTYSSWAYHELTGCRSLAQTERGNNAFWMCFSMAGVVFVILFCCLVIFCKQAECYDHAVIVLMSCLCISFCICLVVSLVSTVRAH